VYKRQRGLGDVYKRQTQCLQDWQVDARRQRLDLHLQNDSDLNSKERSLDRMVEIEKCVRLYSCFDYRFYKKSKQIKYLG
jgi:hypothetical protein